MEISWDTDVELDTIEKAFIRLREEYNGQAFKNHQKLELLNLSIAFLPKHTKDLLDTCSSFCDILGLEDFTKRNLMLKNTELILKKHHIHKIECKGKLQQIKINKLLKELQEQSAVLKRECEKSVKVGEDYKKQSEQIAGFIAFFQEKLKSYHDNATEMEFQISQMEPRCELKDIFECGEHLKSMDKEIDDLENKLAMYRNLPADITVAKEKVKQEKMELEKCEEELTKLIEQYVQRIK